MARIIQLLLRNMLDTSWRKHDICGLHMIQKTKRCVNLSVHLNLSTYSTLKDFRGLFMAPYIIAGITAHLEMTTGLPDELEVTEYPCGALALSTAAVCHSISDSAPVLTIDML